MWYIFRSDTVNVKWRNIKWGKDGGRKEKTADVCPAASTGEREAQPSVLTLG